MSFIDTEVILSRTAKAEFNSSRKPKGDHREVALPAKRRFKQTPPPPIEIEQTFVVYKRRDGTKVAILATFIAPESWTSLGVVDAFSAEEALKLI